MIKQTGIYYEWLYENPHPNTQISTPTIQYKPWKATNHPHLHQWQGVFLGECGFFVTKQSQFEAADVAWFAAGMHEDGAHDHPYDHFHLLHNDVHQEVSNAYMDPKGVKVQKSDQTRDWTQDLLDIYQIL